ncbi:hypothetical protein BU121_05705 [Staphylococcus xylosus]|uniref:hypothetical protein n=1 Tax=Staphylococcus xylosus TaxID=1288 RepID=UPI000E67A297|nr:hypothetical protein [Staphylococcus xylosus]RIM79119.1 hypothetical protein BU121_05705 [Staphylococcus xylosus]
MSAPYVVMLLLTIIAVTMMIIICMVLDKSMIYMFIILFIHSTLLFIIRYFWQNKELGEAFTHSFDFLTIVIVIIFAIYKITKDKSRE